MALDSPGGKTSGGEFWVTVVLVLERLFESVDTDAVEYFGVDVVDEAVFADHDYGVHALVGLVQQDLMQPPLVGGIDPGPGTVLAGAGDRVAAFEIERRQEQNRSL